MKMNFSDKNVHVFRMAQTSIHRMLGLVMVPWYHFKQFMEMDTILHIFSKNIYVKHILLDHIFDKVQNMNIKSD